MNSITQTPSTTTHSVGPQEGDHSTIGGIMSMLNLWLNRSLEVLNLFDSLNKSQLYTTGKLQILGQKESTQLGNLTKDLQNYINQGGAQAYDMNGPLPIWYNASSPDQSAITSRQAAISNLQLQFNNETSLIQTKSDIEKDTSSTIESDDSSLLQSIDSGIISILQNRNSIRLN